LVDVAGSCAGAFVMVSGEMSASASTSVVSGAEALVGIGGSEGSATVAAAGVAVNKRNRHSAKQHTFGILSLFFALPFFLSEGSHLFFAYGANGGIGQWREEFL
jgi:hypothetical protein